MALPRVKIADLEPKQAVLSTYLVKYIAVMEARDGKKYLNIILSDGTGDLESRIWNNAEEIFDRIAKGSFVSVEGRVNLFQGRKQFIITKIDLISEDDIDRGDFITKSKEGPEKMYQELLEIIDGLTDVYIRDLLKSIVTDTEIARRLKLWQAGKSIHHAYQSGLLEHILSCSNLALMLSGKYNVNVNYVVAGAVLHDLCKVYELTDGMNVDYTEEGKLVGHLVKGIELVDRFSYRIKDFPYQTKLHLKHILLSHHGEYAYGSPKIPQTSEAMLVHLIDFMDSKMHTFETIKRTDNNVGHWSGYVRHMDRIVFKDELPYFPDYIDDTEVKSVSTSTSTKMPSPAKKEKRVSHPPKELKQNLGSVLKNFKVDGNS